MRVYQRIASRCAGPVVAALLWRTDYDYGDHPNLLEIWLWELADGLIPDVDRSGDTRD